MDHKTMHIPAGQADVTHAYTEQPAPFLAALTGGVFQNDRPITLHLVGLHMHLLGTRTRLDIQRGSGERECLLDIPRWNFNWQQLYGLVQPKVVSPGDALSLECHWDNSAPGARDVNWGEGTSDEMCLGIFYMTQD